MRVRVPRSAPHPLVLSRSACEQADITCSIVLSGLVQCCPTRPVSCAWVGISHAAHCGLTGVYVCVRARPNVGAGRSCPVD